MRPQPVQVAQLVEAGSELLWKTHAVEDSSGREAGRFASLF